MSRTKTLPALAAIALLPALFAMGCRGGEATSQQAGTAPVTQETARPPQGTTWTTDAPPAVTGATGLVDGTTASAERERQIAEREAAVAQREAEVARRESASTSRPRTASTSRRSTPSRRATPSSAPRRTEVAAAPRESQPAPAPPPVREVTRVTVPSGTTLTAEVTNGASTATSQVGDSVSARVSDNVYAGGVLAIPAGSRLSGTVTEVRGLRKVGGRALLAVRFDSVELPNGNDAPIYAAWSAQGRNETGRDAATIGGSAAGGAVLGRVLSHGRRRDERTAQGAAVGAVIGTVIAARNQRNGQVELPVGTVLDLTLSDSVRVTVD